jgi:hypothetical protein
MKRLLTYLAFTGLLLIPSATAVPTITYTLNTTAGNNGWYVSASATFVVGPAGATPGGACTQVGANVIAFPQGSGNITCTSSHEGGTATLTTPTLSYDSVAPSVSGSAARGPDSNGWYTRPVEISFTGSDGTSGLAGCSGPGVFSGPDGTTEGVGGFCRDNAGNVGSANVTVPYDATPPQATGAQPDRPPDVNGWYNHPVSLSFVGRDSGSQIESCTQTTYGGPDKADVSISGTCRDKAGHTSAPFAYKLKYDSTPPKLNKVAVTAGNGFARLKLAMSRDVASVEITRKPGKDGAPESVVFRGKAQTFRDSGLKNGTRYEYSVAALDEAGNADRKTARAVPRAALYAPANGATVTGSTVLRWLAVPRATYYNAQVWFKGRKVLSTWPAKTSLRLNTSWRYNGRTYRLQPGVYRWYVWPGFGPRTARRYGKLAGVSSFVVTG